LLNQIDHIGGHPIYNRAVMQALAEVNPNLSPENVAAEVQKISDTLLESIKQGTYGPWG